MLDDEANDLTALERLPAWKALTSLDEALRALDISEDLDADLLNWARSDLITRSATPRISVRTTVSGVNS